MMARWRFICVCQVVVCLWLLQAGSVTDAGPVKAPAQTVHRFGDDSLVIGRPDEFARTTKQPGMEQDGSESSDQRSVVIGLDGVRREDDAAAARQQAAEAEEEAYEEQSASERGAEAEAFREWLAAGGATVEGISFEPSEVHGLGVVAARDLQSMEVVISVPAGLAVTHETALADPFLGPVLAPVLDGSVLLTQALHVDPRDFALAVYLTYHRFYHEASPLQPWLDVMPTTHTGMVSTFTEDEMRLLTLSETSRAALEENDAFAYGVCREMRRLVAEPHMEYFHDDARRIEKRLQREVIWAIETLLTRAIVQADGSRILIPGVDMFNHADDGLSIGADIAASGDSSGGGEGEAGTVTSYTVRSPDFATADEELFLSYGDGDMCNMVALLRYGFVSSGAPHDCAHITITPQLAGSFGEVKRAMLVEQEGAQVGEALSFGGAIHNSIPLSPLFVRVLRIMLLEVQDFPEYRRALNDRQVGLENELRVVREFMHLVDILVDRNVGRRRQAFMTELVPTDKAAWSSNQKAIMEMLDGEVRALAWAQEQARDLWIRVIDSDLLRPEQA